MTYDEKVYEAIRLSSNGNNDAWSYLSIIAQVARVIDDLVDKPSEVDAETKYKLAQLLLVELDYILKAQSSSEGIDIKRVRVVKGRTSLERNFG